MIGLAVALAELREALVAVIMPPLERIALWLQRQIDRVSR